MRPIFGLLLSFGSLSAFANEKVDQRLPSLVMPKGFSISVFARGLDNARSLKAGPNGWIFVSTLEGGNVYAIRDADGDGRAEVRLRIAQGLNLPNGVAFRDGALYVAEVNRVLRYPDIEAKLQVPASAERVDVKLPEPEVILDTLPKDRPHGWKFIAFGPDGWLYVPVGAPCNICVKDDERYSTILRMDVRKQPVKPEVYVRGVRNTVGFDWDPQTKHLWFTDNGRDMLGDDIPPDELNHVVRAGQNFGFPYCYGKGIPDPEFGAHLKGKKCSDFVPPAAEFDAHVAALGMRFNTGKRFPARYRSAIFVAHHGSWNRTVPTGYRVVAVFPQAKGPAKVEPFITGWLAKDGVWGRPVDVLVQPDGSLLVSDDMSGVVYRVLYQEQ